MAIQKKISRRKLRARVGQRVTALLEGPSAENELVWEARLEGMAPEIDGKVFITDMAGVNDVADLPSAGTMATVEITSAKEYDLIGRVVEFESGVAARRSSGARAYQTSQQSPATMSSPFSILA
jgi:ribosomal protein S12 methylthiotransferase